MDIGEIYVFISICKITAFPRYMQTRHHLLLMFQHFFKKSQAKSVENASLYRFFSVADGLFAAMLKIICAKAKDVVILHSANSAMSVDGTN